MIRSRLVPFVAIGVLSVAGCAETDPAKPATWLAKLGDKDKRVVIDAIDHLGKLKATEAVPQLIAQLKSDNGSIREEAAGALGEIGDKQAVSALADAMDLATSDKAMLRANYKIADAFGALGDKAATPTLLKMLRAHDELLRVHAVQALDKLLDPKATADLAELVTNDRTPMLVVKHAVITLGDMRAVEAVPALAKALVIERNGASVFPEASYALFQIGSPAVPTLTGLLDGTDTAYFAWAEALNRKPAGPVSKAAIVLADIADPSSIPSLVKALNWKDPEDNSSFTALVHGKVAEALGRLRAKAAAAPLANSLAAMDEANMRALYAQALAHIADPIALPKMEAAIKNVKDSWTDRQETITGMALLGDAKQKATLDGVQKVETTEKIMKECTGIETSDTPEAKQVKCKKLADDRVQFISDEIARLLAGDACKQDLACWSGKLKDPAPKVRERAAYELGKLGTAASVEPLLSATKDDKMFVRHAVYIALDWLTSQEAAKSALKAKVSVLAKQYDDEKSSVLTEIVNEDLKRVIWKIQHI